jgi:hypothetical protein
MNAVSPRFRAFGLLLLVLPLFAACDILEGGDPPANGRVELDSEAGQQLTVILSTDFDIVGGNPEVGGTIIEINEADTSQTTSPGTINVPLGPRQRMYFKMVAPGELTTPVAARIYIEADLISTKVVQSPGDSAVFVYTFSSF